MNWKNSYHPYAAVTILFWSMAFVFTRLALPYFSAFSLGLWRYVAASAVLLVVAVATRMKPPKLRDVPWFLLAGAVGFAGLARVALERGFDKVFLQVEAQNDPALALYRRAGFETRWQYRYWQPST